MRKGDLIKHLEQLSEDDLREEVLHLYDKVDGVKAYYKLELGSTKDRAKIYEKAKKDIASKFATRSLKKPRRPRIQKLNLLLGQLDKAAIFPHEMIDIYLYTCECAVEFKRRHLFKSQPLDNVIISSFDQAIGRIIGASLKDEYLDRCSDLAERIKFFDHLNEALLHSFVDLFTNKP